MKSGEKGIVDCPSVHDTKKGLKEVNLHHHKGHNWHKSKNDVTYDLEVISCKPELDKPRVAEDLVS